MLATQSLNGELSIKLRLIYIFVLADVLVSMNEDIAQHEIPVNNL